VLDGLERFRSLARPVCLLLETRCVSLSPASRFERTRLLCRSGGLLYLFVAFGVGLPGERFALHLRLCFGALTLEPSLFGSLGFFRGESLTLGGQLALLVGQFRLGHRLVGGCRFILRGRDGIGFALMKPALVAQVLVSGQRSGDFFRLPDDTVEQTAALRHARYGIVFHGSLL
jgi:hypothetical protein